MRRFLAYFYHGASVHLTDEQWSVVSKLLAEDSNGPERRGRPTRNLRHVLDGILWYLCTGAPWQDLPPRFPPHQTCHRWLLRWTANGTLQKVLDALAQDLSRRGGMDINEALQDAAHAATANENRIWTGFRIGSGPRSWQTWTTQIFVSLAVSKAWDRGR